MKLYEVREIVEDLNKVSIELMEHFHTVGVDDYLDRLLLKEKILLRELHQALNVYFQESNKTP